MRLLIVIASFWVLVAAKPELYKEKEDFQYSRSSTDEGSKSGYYGAQRGNMGGNYERAHNMDSLAQHHMSTAVRNVEGELGEGAKTRTGSVFSAASSRGLYGSGNYDLSNLRGRNFGEGAISDSLSQSSGLASQYLQTDAQKAADNIYSASNYDYDSKAHNYKYAQSSSQAQSEYENRNSASGYDQKVNSDLVYATPVRVYIKPGARIAIPVAAHVYDASAVHGLNTVHTDSEILDTTGQRLHYKPTSNAKHYESAYRYRKEWEKHNSIPVTVNPMESPIPTNSELYEDAQLSHTANNQYESGLASAANRQSSSANSAYLSGYSASTKNALSSQSRHQSEKYDSGVSASNAYNYGTSSSNAYKSGATDSNAYTHGYEASLAANLGTANNLIEDISSKPKSYQSAYSYHKSWERRGDPYVIKPVGGDLNEQTSQRLTANHGYACTYCLDGSQQRVRRDLDFGLDKLGDQLQNFGEQAGNQISQNMEDLGQQAENFGGKLENFGDEVQGFGQRSTDKLSEGLEDFGQRSTDKLSQGLEDFGQQAQGFGDKLEDLGQQTSDKLEHGLEDFGQQTQSHWGKLGDLGQQTRNNINEHKWELDHSNNRDSLGSFSQGMQSPFGDAGGRSHFDEQTQSHFGDMGNFGRSHFGEQTQSHFGDMGNFGRSHFDEQTQSHFGDMGSFGRSNFGEMGSLGRSHFGEQTQSHFGDLGQRTQSQFGNLDNFGQQTQSHWGKLNDFGQQSQSDWNLGQQGQAQSVANFDQVINDYGGHQFNKLWMVDGSFVPSYINYWEIPEPYYVKESLENINKRWNFHKNFEQGSYFHHHDFELEKSQAAHNTHNSDVSCNVNHFNHPEKPKENTAAQNSEGILIPTIVKNVQNGTTTAKYVTLDDSTLETTPKTVDADEIYESFTIVNVHPIDIGRGDIGPEDTLIETTDINEKKSIRTPEKIESSSLTKDQRDISEGLLNLSVTGFNQGSNPGNKRKLRNELSTVIESVTISTAKSKENLDNNMNFIPIVYSSTPKSYYLSTSSIKAFNEKENDAKQMRATSEQDERKTLDTFEEQNWGQQSFYEQKINHLELFKQNVAQQIEAFEEKNVAQNFGSFKKQNKEQHLEPFEDKMLVQQLELSEKQNMGHNLETLEDPYFGQQLENFEQQNIAQNLEPFEQQQKPLENMEQLEPNQIFDSQLHSFDQKNGRQLNIPEEQNILKHDFEQKSQILAHRNILQNTETSSTGIETSPENKYLQEHNEHKGQNVEHSKDNTSTSIEPTRELPGFWGSLWNKTKSAKNSLVSWFHS